MLYAFLDQMRVQANELSEDAKQVWKRPRPFVAHPDRIHPLFTAGGYSYPSGHSTVAFCEAVILGQRFPEKSRLLLEDAARIAQSRVVAGVHYETDVKAGEILGREVAQELLNTAEFRNELAAVRTEVPPQK